MPHHTATPSRRSRTKLRMRRCHRAESPIVQALNYEFDAANRLAAMTVGAVDTSPTTRYVHNALGLRLFKTEPQFPPAAGDENDPAFMASLIAFFTNLWGGNTGAANPSASEKLGFQYFYDEDGSLLYELGSGGANSTGAAHYVYLPTPSGPMPVAFYNGSKHYAVQTDHLNTPRRLTQSDKKVAWQWAFSAFGDEQPTTGKNRYVDPATTPNAGSTTVADVTFNLRYPGQYFDKESGLSYNYFRSYDSRTGRYSQSDPIDLAGGWNKFAYVSGNPLSGVDPLGLLEDFTFDRAAATVTHDNCGCANNTTPAFSGNNEFANKPEFENLPFQGPIPSGTYYIVEPYHYQSLSGAVFFKLYRDDGVIDDSTTTPNGTKRGQFRFHPGNASDGCVTVPKRTNAKDWYRIQNKLLGTKVGIIPGTNITYYGTVKVK
jgi:RHS repeat-associated protein